MIEQFLAILPEVLKNTETGQLNSLGIAVVGLLWALLFLSLGVVLGRFFFLRCRRAVIELENENRKGLLRVDNYRATVDSQTRSTQRWDNFAV